MKVANRSNDKLGFHESGVCVPIVNLNNELYVAVLFSAPVRQKDGSYWGTVDIGDNQKVGYMDVPAGKTRQFEDSSFVKRFYPKGGKGPDPGDESLIDHYELFENGQAAAIRERDEETHKVFHNVPNSRYDVYTTNGGYKSAYGNSIVTVVFQWMVLQERNQMTQYRLKFLKQNDILFESYEDWRQRNPDASEAVKWKKRPEYMGMTFVTFDSFICGLYIANQQMDKYNRKESSHKAIVLQFTDYMGRPFFAAFRSFPVYVLQRSGVMKQVIFKITNN